MTLTDFLQEPRCIFCDQKMVILSTAKDCVECPTHRDQQSDNYCWCWLRDDNTIYAINIKIDDWQLHFGLNNNETLVINRRSGKTTKFNRLLDMQLNKETLVSKMKTMVIFS